MNKAEQRPRKRRPRLLYLEEYRCGCTFVGYRGELIGYCGKHGESRRRVHAMGYEDDPRLSGLTKGPA